MEIILIDISLISILGLVISIIKYSNYNKKVLLKLSELTGSEKQSLSEYLEEIRNSISQSQIDTKSVVVSNEKNLNNVLNETISVKDGFNEILSGAADVGKKTEEKMTLVGKAAETSKNIVHAVSSITNNMELQVETFE